MGVHRFRLTAEQERRLKAVGVRASTRAKELLEAEIRRIDYQDRMRCIERFVIKPTKPIEKTIREIRDNY